MCELRLLLVVVVLRAVCDFLYGALDPHDVVLATFDTLKLRNAATV